MTKEEHNKKLSEIENDRRNAIERLNSDYALSNNPVEIGDIVTDHQNTIRVDSITIVNIYMLFGSNLPYCRYIGVALKKDLTPKKNGSRIMISQPDIVKIRKANHE